MQRSAPIRGWTFEYVMWLFIRVSGLTLYVVALFGVGTALYLGARTQMDMATLIRWTFFPNANHVINSSINDIAPWSGVLWKVMQSLAVFFGVTHGLNGLRNIIEDYLTSSKTRFLVRAVLFVVWAFFVFAAMNLVLNAD